MQSGFKSISINRQLNELPLDKVLQNIRRLDVKEENV